MIVSPHPYPHSPQVVSVLGMVVLTLLALAAALLPGRHLTPNSDPVSITVAADPTLLVRGKPDLPLRPGAVRPLNLSFANRSDRDVLLTRLSVTVTGVNAPRATACRPCSGEDYRADAGHLPPLRLPARSTVTLAASGAPRSSWPSVRMLDTPRNQDGCQTATVTLDYRTVLEAG